MGLEMLATARPDLLFVLWGRAIEGLQCNQTTRQGAKLQVALFARGNGKLVHADIPTDHLLTQFSLSLTAGNERAR
jgi:hypothetical protein